MCKVKMYSNAFFLHMIVFLPLFLEEHMEASAFVVEAYVSLILLFLYCSATQFTATKCNICNNELELPSVHFLCRHSFHQQ